MKIREMLVFILSNRLEIKYNFFFFERNILNGNLVSIFGDVRGFEMSNRFLVRIRKMYFCSGISFLIL